MSIEQYKYENKTGRNLSFAALLALAGPGMIDANEATSPSVNLPSAIVQFIQSSDVDIDFEVLFKDSDGITEYVSLVDAAHMNDPESIVKNALEQINNLNYIEVDDEIDREIDAFFASRESKKVKKIIHKRL